jgi:uncharacterized protein (DUF1501 family)
MLIKRRHVLAGLGSIGLAPLLCDSLAAAEPGASNLILVVVYLSGGNDGLNTVVPLTDYGDYYKLRTPGPPPLGLNMAYAEEDLSLLAFNSDYTVPVLSANQFAFAPSMVAMRDLYATGKLAVINGIGLPSQEQNALSHSNATIDWMTGQINVNLGLAQPAGWLGLTLDGVKGGALGPMISLSGTAPVMIGNTSMPMVINPPMDYFGINYGLSDNGKVMAADFAKIGMLTAASPTGVFNQGVLNSALNDIVTVQGIAKKEKPTTYPLDSNNWLDYQFRDIARLIIGGAGARAYFAAQGGYDTHSAQSGSQIQPYELAAQPLLLQQLSESFVKFYEFLNAAGAAKNVVVATVSDFGRRPLANLDFGTDHGGATSSFVFGDPVKGGTYGTYPSLKKFDANQNLVINIDFRNLIFDLINAMGSTPPSYLGTYTPIGFI